MKLTWPFCRHFILVSHNCPWCAGRDAESLTWKPMSYRADTRPVEIVRALLDMLPKDVDALDIAEQRIARVLSGPPRCSMCATGELVSDDGEHFVGGDLIRCRRDTR